MRFVPNLSLSAWFFGWAVGIGNRGYLFYSTQRGDEPIGSRSEADFPEGRNGESQNVCPVPDTDDEGRLK